MQTKSNDDFSTLVKKVKNFKFSSPDDLPRVMSLSDSVFDEWRKLRQRFRMRLMCGGKSSLKFYEILEAEEQLVVGLLAVLSDKLISYISGVDILMDS